MALSFLCLAVGLAIAQAQCLCDHTTKESFLFAPKLHNKLPRHYMEVFRKPCMLYSQNGFFLQIRSNGDVFGARTRSALNYDILELWPATTGLSDKEFPFPTLKKRRKRAIYIRGVISKRFLCMTKGGHLYGRVS